MKTYIIAAGSYLPGEAIHNEQLTQFPKEKHSLIYEKTGILNRHYADTNEATSDLATKAGRACLAQQHFHTESVDAVILSTSTPDCIIPSSAPTVQYNLGLANAFAFDVNAVCSGGVAALLIAHSMICAARAKTVLVVAADTYSRFLNKADFSTAPYFGDGAGAILLHGSSDESVSNYHLVDILLKSDGSGSSLIQIPNSGSRMPTGDCMSKERYFKMNGRAVFDFAVRAGTSITEELLQRNRVAVKELRWLIPHQANLRICEQIAENLGLARDILYTNLDRCANTASASCLVALSEIINEPNHKTSGYVCIPVFGGGLTYGAALLRVN